MSIVSVGDKWLDHSSLASMNSWASPELYYGRKGFLTNWVVNPLGKQSCELVKFRKTGITDVEKKKLRAIRQGGALAEMSLEEKATVLAGMSAADVAAALATISPEEQHSAQAAMSAEHRAAALAASTPEDRAAQLDSMTPEKQAEALTMMTAAQQAAALVAMTTDKQAAALEAMSPEKRAAAIDAMPVKDGAAALAVIDAKKSSPTDIVDEQDCGGVADSVLEEVQATIQQQQQVLDTLDKGEDCPNEGQEEVAKHETLVEAATKKDEDALGLLNAAKNAEVNFGSYSIASLQSMDCSAMFQDASYLAAKKTRSDAESVCITTEAELKEAKTDYDSAVANAKHAKLVCQCNVKALYAREWDLVEKDKPKRDAAWKKAKLLECTLKGNFDHCDFDPAPNVIDKGVIEDVTAQECEDVYQ